MVPSTYSSVSMLVDTFVAWQRCSHLYVSSLFSLASPHVALQVGHGAMTMTHAEFPEPDEVYFATFKKAISLMPPGAKLFVNAGTYLIAQLKLHPRRD